MEILWTLVISIRQVYVWTIAIYLLENSWNRLDPWLLSEFMLDLITLYLSWKFGWNGKSVLFWRHLGIKGTANLNMVGHSFTWQLLLPSICQTLSLLTTVFTNNNEKNYTNIIIMVRLYLIPFKLFLSARMYQSYDVIFMSWRLIVLKLTSAKTKVCQ